MSSPAKSSNTIHTAQHKFAFFSWARLAVALLTILAAALRLSHLTARSLSLDDGFSTFLARTNPSVFAGWLWHSEFNMALYYVLLRLWMQLGHGEFLLRFLSVLFASATIPVIYLVGARLFGRNTGLLAALLLAVHPFHVELSQVVRSYSLLVFLVTLSSLCFLRLLDKPALSREVVWAVVSALAIYSHFVAWLVIAAQLLSLLFLRQAVRWKSWIRGVGMLGLMLLPAIAYLLHPHQSPLSWVPTASFQLALTVLYSLTLNRERCLLYIAMWAIATWCALHRRVAQSWPYWFTLGWLLVPLITVAMIGIVQSMWVPRYLSICIPAAVLLGAAGLIQVFKWWSRIAGTAVLLVLLITSSSGVRAYLRHAQFSADWRSAIQYLLPRLQTGDQIVFDPYVQYVYEVYRDLYAQSVPPVLVTASFSAPVASPAPESIWVMIPVLLNPDDPRSGREGAQQLVNEFLAAHGQSYCALPPQPQGNSVLLWQLVPCAER